MNRYIKYVLKNWLIIPLNPYPLGYKRACTKKKNKIKKIIST